MSYFADPHESLRAEVRRFAEDEVRPRVARMEAEGKIEHALSREIARRGWIGATIPQEYGGMGAGHFAKTIIIEELSRVSGAMGAMAQASQLGVAKVIHFGTEEQKAHWLPLFASGKSLPTIAVTEPDSGGHVLGMTSRAERQGNEYVLNGRKWFVGNSHIGDVHGVVLRTGTGSRGLTAFLVESDRPGFRLGEPGDPFGLQGFSFGEIVFEDCALPLANRLGAEGQGLEVAYSSSVLYGRPNLTAVALGIHKAVMEDTIRFCQERTLYGEPLGDLPNIERKVGEMQSRLMIAELAAYHATELLDRGLPCDAELINAKLLNYEYAVSSAKDALEIHAARGLQRSYNIERYYRDAVHIYAPAGTSDIQRHRLGQVAFGSYGRQWSTRLADRVSFIDPNGRGDGQVAHPNVQQGPSPKHFR